MCASVIGIASGLTASEHAAAVAVAPPYPIPLHDLPPLLRRAGWRLLDRSDLTTDYLDAARRRLAAADRCSDGLARLLGPGEVASTQEQRRRTVAAIEAGLVHRELFTCAAA